MRSCGVGCKEPIPSSFIKTGSTKAATFAAREQPEIFATEPWVGVIAQHSLQRSMRVTLPEQERHYEDRQIRLERRSPFYLAGYI